MKSLKLVFSLLALSLFMLSASTSQAQATLEDKNVVFEELRNNKIEPFASMDPQSLASFISIAVFDEELNFRGTSGATPEILNAIGRENYSAMIEILSTYSVEKKNDATPSPKRSND